MSYPPPQGPDQNNPYGQQPGYQQQPGQQQPGGYGYPGQQPGGYPGQPYPHAGYVQNAYAGFGSRVVARLIDMVIIGVVPVILFIAGAAGSEPGEGPGPLFFLGYLVMFGGYIFLAYMVGTTGQTPGRKAVNIQVIKESTGQPIGFGLAIGRWLLDIVNGLPCYLGYLWPLWDAKKQTFADKIVGSVVVKKN